MSPALRVAMDEALLLDRQGFIVPPAAQNLALQQRHYVGLADLLGSMLTSYHQVRLPAAQGCVLHQPGGVGLAASSGPVRQRMLPSAGLRCLPQSQGCQDCGSPRDDEASANSASWPVGSWRMRVLAVR